MRSCLMTMVLLGALVAALAAPVRADEPWEAEVNTAREEQDREIREAARAGTLERVVAKYMSQLGRQETALNTYLVGRALFYAGRGADAIQYMQKTLARDAGFWFAEKGLARLFMAKGDLESAQKYLVRVRARRPLDLELIRLDVDIKLGQNELKAALPLLKDIVTRETDPQSRTMARMALVEVYRQLGDAESAVGELAVLVKQHPDRIEFRESYAAALAETGKLAEAAGQFERVLRLNPASPNTLQALFTCYAQTRNLKGVLRTVERMRDLATDPEAKKRLESLIAALKEQGLAVLERRQPEEEWKPDPLTELVKRCLDEDPDLRYAAYVEYFDNRVPLVPLILYRRLNPEEEPDARCRLMLVRILGQLESLEATPRIAAALWDPAVKVRRVATEELGRFTSPAMLAYLHPYFFGLPIEPLPSDPRIREAMESEYNAAREALRDLTSFRDLPIGERHVGAAQFVENRARWKAYFETDLGKRSILDAIEAFSTLGDPYPEVTLLSFVMPDGVDIEIVRAAYDVILAYADAALTGDDEYMKERWTDFPRIDSKTFQPDNVKILRERLKTYFKERRKRQG